jgi:hypothetical protein
VRERERERDVLPVAFARAEFNELPTTFEAMEPKLSSLVPNKLQAPFVHELFPFWNTHPLSSLSLSP